MMNVLGVDVSAWQGVVDWRKAYAAGARYAFARASIGARVDDKFALNAQAAPAAGLLFGAYLVIHPTVSPAQHIDAFMRAVGGAVFDFPVMLDCEISGGISQSAYRTLIEAVARGLDDRSLAQAIYTRASWWNANVAPSAYLESLPLWVAHYGAAQPTLPRGWQDWAMWQWSADGNRRGAEFGAQSADIDINWMKPEFFAECGGVIEPETPDIPDLPNEILERVNALEIGLVAAEIRLAALEARVAALESAPARPAPPTQPEFDTRVVVSEKAVAFAENGKNGAGAPIININAYQHTGDSRLKWLGGQTLKTKGAAIKADGGCMWYLLHDVPLHGFEALYVRDEDVQ